MFLYFAIAALLYLFFKWGNSTYDYFEKKGIAFSKPTFLIGSDFSSILKRLSLPEMVEKWYHEFKNEK